jgi:hypothetical protein
MTLAFTTVCQAVIFTASNNGDFTSSSTWEGGIVPPTDLLIDGIIIPEGITVNMNTSLLVNGPLAIINVMGTLNSSNTSVLSMEQGTLSGTGIIIIHSINLGEQALFTFSGNLSANNFTTLADIATSSAIIVAETLSLQGAALNFNSGGSFSINPNGTIVIMGGSFGVSTGGSVNLSNTYDVVYSGVSAIAGLELTGAGLRNVTVSVGAANNVALTTDLTVSGALGLSTGRLLLNEHDLTLNGSVVAGGDGTISSTAYSNVSINCPQGTIGVLTFSNSTVTVNNLAINVGNGNEALIGGFLIVAGEMQLNSGILNFHNARLTAGGTISGNGLLSGNMGSDLHMETTAGSAAVLNFAANGQVLNDLVIALGNADMVFLGSDLSVHGDILLLNGSHLDLNGHHITLEETADLGGSGSFITSPNANMTIHAIGGITALRMIGSIGNFTLNSMSGTVALGSHLTVEGLLYLQSGELVLNNRDITINSNISALGTGSISSTSTSDVIISGTVSPNGHLNFTEGANTIGGLSISMFNSSTVTLGSDLHVSGILNFISGKLGVHSHMLTIDPSGSITGEAVGSYIITSAGGSLERSIVAGALVATSFPVGTESSFAPANISLATGSGSGRVNVGVINGVMAQGTSGVEMAIDQPLVNATWNIGSTVSNSNLDLNLQVMWSAGMEVNSFDRSAVYIAHHIGGAWDTHTLENATTEPAGMYSIQRDGISDLSPFAVFNESTTTALDDRSEDLNFQIYPNPTIDMLVVKNTTGSIEPIVAQIWSATGQLITTHRLTGTINNIDVSGLAPGHYAIRFSNSAMVSSQHFIKM